ncbi:MAG: hypothetical protein QOH71_197 [Blastocatellia bacterium]|jgi:hypothetical protein|nr:hypothetical protein [Blastocatellia bacterium]
MSEKIIVTVDENGSPTVTAYCLKTDSWHDFLAFRDDARHVILEGDQRRGNRFLRAALTCLFSHLEAIVKDIGDHRQIPNLTKRQRLRLCDKTENITREAEKHGKIPVLNFRLGKHLRDLIAHPGIEIDFPNAPSGKLDSTSVFEDLDLSTLDALEAQISSWIDAICAALGISRFTDTKQLVIELGESMGSVNDVREV